MKKRFVYFSLIVLSTLLLLSGCSDSGPKAYSEELMVMDTHVKYIVISDDKKLAKQGLEAIKKVFIVFDGMTNRLSKDSQIFAVNAAAGKAPVKVDESVFAMIEIALDWSYKTDGAFNILTGSAMDLWGFGQKNQSVPKPEEINKVLVYNDFTKIVMDKKASTIYLPESGMVLDVGGVAKGYATDLAVKALRELGIESALINAGGNVYTLGKREDGTAWNIGIQDPRRAKEITRIFKISDKAMVTCGDYQRYFIKDGTRYHNILDPETGFPASLCTATTIVMDSALVANIIANATFVQGPERGLDFVDSLPEVDGALFISADGSITMTESMKQYLLKE